MTNTPLPPLRLGRMHEVHGPSAHGFTAISARGTALWVREGWQKAALLPSGVATILSTDRLILATPATPTDALAVAEEALRDGAVQTVILEISAPLNLREGRRLQLAAKARNTLGICILPNAAMGSNAAETRWHCAPIFDGGADSTLMRWSLNKNKSGTIGAWHVRWNEEAHHLDVVAAPAVGTMGAPPDG